MDDVQTKTLVNTMQYLLPEVKAQTPVKTVRDEASVNTLANSIAEVRADKIGKTLLHVMGASQVQMLVASPTEAQAKTRNTGRPAVAGSGQNLC